MRSRNRRGDYNTFSMQVCTFNRTTGKGGERLVFEKAALYEKSKKQTGTTDSTRSRNPHHDFNGTRNIILHPSGEIRSIHVRLIERFNNKIVYD